MFSIPEMLLHFHFEERLYRLLHQVLKNGFGIERLAATAGANLGNEQLLERLRILNQRGEVGSF
jgi:hypothetical protein